MSGNNNNNSSSSGSSSNQKGKGDSKTTKQNSLASSISASATPPPNQLVSQSTTPSDPSASSSSTSAVDTTCYPGFFDSLLKQNGYKLNRDTDENKDKGPFELDLTTSFMKGLKKKRKNMHDQIINFFEVYYSAKSREMTAQEYLFQTPVEQIYLGEQIQGGERRKSKMWPSGIRLWALFERHVDAFIKEGSFPNKILFPPSCPPSLVGSEKSVERDFINNIGQIICNFMNVYVLKDCFMVIEDPVGKNGTSDLSRKSTVSGGLLGDFQTQTTLQDKDKGKKPEIVAPPSSITPPSSLSQTGNDVKLSQMDLVFTTTKKNGEEDNYANLRIIAPVEVKKFINIGPFNLVSAMTAVPDQRLCKTRFKSIRTSILQLVAHLRETRSRFGMITTYNVTWFAELNPHGVLTISNPIGRDRILRSLCYFLDLAFKNELPLVIDLPSTATKGIETLKIFGPYFKKMVSSQFSDSDCGTKPLDYQEVHTLDKEIYAPGSSSSGSSSTTTSTTIADDSDGDDISQDEGEQDDSD